MTRNENNNRPDIYSRITDQIIKSLEQEIKPWMQPWNAAHAAGPGSRPLRHNGQPYGGINVLTLWASAMDRNFAAPLWMTFKQSRELGGNVRKGEKGSPVVYANTLSRTEIDASTGEEFDKKIPFMKGYTVFNVEQIDGLPDHFYAPAETQLNPEQKVSGAEEFFAETGADIRHGGNSAYYSPPSDFIQMPDFENFRDAQGYYSTLAHECTHWTRHKSRLDREFGRKRFGDEGYAQEELVAELGAAFLCADLQITLEEREDHTAYIASWLKVLKNDKRAIFTAAAHAQRAAEFLHGLQPVIDELDEAV